ncbi:proto-oncogene tyrosine-protein kinase receptor Ret isoform X2 [Anthonomus grandis grandis]|uniref:proto-oncogene tyrosine-protein kinase receptor Ret isoform X2 n=1 Tax=Anthonomus grandis grandis TaxID=2921223 RepID=UPI0021663939|nr:proto-oncogene tyrosine-protein kinase receptor Ret isoform X2 [Anthonomus grandis grandis]
MRFYGKIMYLGVFCAFLILGINPVEPSINLHKFFDTTYSDYLLKITTSPMSTCDEHQLKDICFWKNMSYLINPDKDKRIGTIGPPQDPDLCNVGNIKYDVIRGADFVKLYPPDSDSAFWTIGVKAGRVGKFEANLECTLLANERTKKFIKTVDIRFEEECTVPVPQDPESIIKLDSKKILKGETFQVMLFLDKSAKGVNTYKAYIKDQTVADYLSPNLLEFQDSREGRNGTIIHYTLTATKTKNLKNDLSFMAALENTNKNCIKENNITGFINVTIKCGTKRIKRSYIFNNNSKILRTAAAYARVTQPHSPSSMTNFKCTTTNVENNPFNITHEGIIYVADSKAIRESPVNTITLNISWTKNNVSQSEEIEVKIINETVTTCDTLGSSPMEWESCASKDTAKSCERKSFCGQGTGGANSVQTRSQLKRCIWRGDDRIISSETVFYHTCTPDPVYCPDNKCDSLEMLDVEYLCPQDCSERVSFPSVINPKTGRGVEECDGVLVCHMGCSCNPPKNDTKKPNVKEGLVRTQEKKESDVLCDTDCILFASGGASLIILALGCIVIWKLIKTKKMYKGKYMDNLPEAETPFSDYVDRHVASEPLVLNFQMSSSLDNNSPNGVRHIRVDPKWKFSRHQLFIEQVLGEGEFGKVLKAKAFNIAGRPGYSLVAVKTLKDDARKQDYNDLFSEFQLLKEVHHPHVIQLLGVCSDDGPLYVIIEYAIFGSLRNHLRRSRHVIAASEAGDIEGNSNHKVTPRDILSFARQIASGMSYLSDIKLVHRDLAARNILLAENKVCKISDFGLTRDIYEDNAYFKKSKGRVPVKWMAPESLADHVYTTKSDVWSFGILIWELVTLGASPYPGIQVHNLYNLLKQGYRMERPPNCSAALYSVMNRCWHSSPEDRPSFLELYHCFDNLLTDNVNYLDLSDNSIINKSYFTNFSIEQDTGSDEKVNFLKNDVEKPCSEEKLLNANMKESVVGYETPVKNPRPVIVTSNKIDEQYTDMDAKK